MSSASRGAATGLLFICAALFAVVLFGVRPAQAQNATAQANMSFSPATVSVGGTSTLTFTLALTAGAGTDLIVTNPSFTDTLPSGLVVATPNGLSIPSNIGTGCNGATVTATAGSGTISFSVAILSVGTSNCVFSVTVKATSAGSLTNSVTMTTVGGNQNSSATLTVTAAASTSDSVKLKALQNQVTPIVAQASGAAISGAIDNAIADAFGDGGPPIGAGPNGVTFNFAAEPRAAVKRRTDEAFSALGYAGNPTMPTKAPPRSLVEREWSLWFDVHGSGWDRNDADADLKGRQVNVTGGLGRKLTPDLLVGIVVGYENFRYESAALEGTMKGNGGTIGAYTAWRLLPTLRWDAALAWSDIFYDGSAGTASGSFTGHRWLASTGLTGSYRAARFILEPSVKVYALWEREDEWTDSLGTPQSAHSFSSGRVATGGKVSYPWMLASGARLAPYVGLYGDWRFGTDDAVPSGQPIVGIGKGWSARATGGIAYTMAGGASLSLGGDYGGLGADYKIWTASVRGNVPF